MNRLPPMAAPQAGSSSLHHRILSDIETRILSGDWPPGRRIPFEHELTASYGCSRMTVSKALSQLAGAGLIERRRKAGSFVRRPHAQSAALEIRDIGAEVAALGLPYRHTILNLGKRRATRAERELLAIGARRTVLAVDCRHDAAERPFCLEERLINLAVVPDAEGETFAGVAPGAWLVAQIPWTSAEHRIRAEAANAETSFALRLRKGASCLVVERRTWSGDQQVTRVKLTYPGDAHELVARFTPRSG